jgi:hypothetical protein
MNKQKRKPMVSILYSVIGLSGQRSPIVRIIEHSVLDGSHPAVLLMNRHRTDGAAACPDSLLEDD